ncbi:MAG TPA: sigma 54-interacting transcriptional regulator [Thermoanaerobaculia bacterium]|jgi:transcriptional regulator with AAA-type ATPase domain|nr:sigma 54-interacting transcriptional regulator [Thermoanaerobaculia bacterium]
MFRLVAYAPDGVRRFPLHRAEMVIGSAPECDLCLPYSGVALQHARLHFEGDALRIEDLGSRKGLLVSGRKVREAALEVLDEIRIGNVTLLVEDIAPQPERAPEAETETDSENAVPAAGDALAAGSGGSSGVDPATAAAADRRRRMPRMTSDRMVNHLTRISEWVLADTESRVSSEALVAEVLAEFGGGVLFLLLGEMDQPGVKLVVSSDPLWLGKGDELLDQVRAHRNAGKGGNGAAFTGELAGAASWVCYHTFTALDRIYTLMVALPRYAPDSWSPIAALRSLGHLLVFGLIHHVGWYEPILPGHPVQQDLTLAPGLVVGESPAMKAVSDRLRVAVGLDSHVLLRGEAGVGKELLARSLHLSGSRRQGPFVTTVCSGARPQQIEADLFGAEVPGKGGVVRREGKLLLAHGGTLFLDDVEQLPLEVQARLVRFLRSGEVEPTGNGVATPVDVRIIAGSRVPLEEVAGHDGFRVDLAYRLSCFAIEVPPLRERREDLPLLIQSYINRFCHETGKRLTGITVKAISALLSYDYPGNVAELENIMRHLVYLSPAGRPVDVSLLPEKVRRASLNTAVRVDAASDLDLERLVGATEQAAIREALRRTHGNKSQAARLLGLSRNGLAIKMQRYGLPG